MAQDGRLKSWYVSNWPLAMVFILTGLFIVLPIVAALFGVHNDSVSSGTETAREGSSSEQTVLAAENAREVREPEYRRDGEQGVIRWRHSTDGPVAQGVEAEIPVKAAAPDTLVRQAQQILAELGYEPGPIDGFMGRESKNAVARFQKDLGFEIDGLIDEDLYASLLQVKALQSLVAAEDEKLDPVDSRSSREAVSTGGLRVRMAPGSSVTGSGYFSIGSHQNDVLRLQGTPAEMVRHPTSGYELWDWGYKVGSVRISTRDRRVMEFTNTGGLRVRMAPGSSVTGSGYFSIGSHQNDVLRLQGTPAEMVRYPASGYELWDWGHRVGSVRISTRDRRVKDFINTGGLRVGREPGSSVTGRGYFSIGSHQEDVLRLQGTPVEIHRDLAPDYELWDWGHKVGSVRISTRDRRVKDFINTGGLRVRSD